MYGRSKPGATELYTYHFIMHISLITWQHMQLDAFRHADVVKMTC